MQARRTTTTARASASSSPRCRRFRRSRRQAIVLREFEGRSYAEIAEILGVTTSALETLLFRARRSLAEELEHQLTCTEAQLAVSQSVDGRLGSEGAPPPARPPGRMPGLRAVRPHAAAAPLGAAWSRARADPALADAVQGSRGERVRRRCAAWRRREHGRGRSRCRNRDDRGRHDGRRSREWCRAQGRRRRRRRRRCRRSRRRGLERGRARALRSPRSVRPPRSSRGARLGQVAPRGVSVPGQRRRARQGDSARPDERPARSQRRTQGDERRRRRPEATARGQTVSAEKRRAAAQRKATGSAGTATSTHGLAAGDPRTGSADEEVHAERRQRPARDTKHTSARRRRRRATRRGGPKEP